MVKTRSQLPIEGGRAGSEMDPIGGSKAPPEFPHQVKVSRRTRDFIPVLLAGGLLILACALWVGRSDVALSNFPPSVPQHTSSPDGDARSKQEVAYATSTAWIEASELWSKFGILGAAFDGERIVMNSAESARGSIGCWISPRGRPMTGVCYETDRASDSRLSQDRSCTWKIVVLEISPSTILGTRSINSEESDPACATNDEPRPYMFVFEKPHHPRSH